MGTSFRGRNFAFILYPQSCVYHWIDMLKRLSKLGVAMAISPLHIPDKSEGEKKEHYHVLMTFEGVKSLESLENLTDMDTGDIFDWHKLTNIYNISKNDIPHFMQINSVCGYYRYLIHKDNKDKQQFDDLKISIGYEGLEDSGKYNTLVHLNGFNNRDYLQRDEKLSADMQLVKLMIDNNIDNEKELIYFLALNNYQYLLDYIHKNLYFVKTFLFYDKGKQTIQNLEKIRKIEKKDKKVNELDFI